MALREIKPMHGEYLYDRDGNLVGKWNGECGARVVNDDGRD